MRINGEYILVGTRMPNRIFRNEVAKLETSAPTPAITTLAPLTALISGGLRDPLLLYNLDQVASQTGMNSTWNCTSWFASCIWLSASKVGGTDSRSAGSALFA